MATPTQGIYTNNQHGSSDPSSAYSNRYKTSGSQWNNGSGTGNDTTWSRTKARDEWMKAGEEKWKSEQAAKEAAENSATSTSESPDVGTISVTALDTNPGSGEGLTDTTVTSVADEAVDYAKSQGPLAVSFTPKEDDNDDIRKQVLESQPENQMKTYDSKEAKGYNKLQGINGEEGTFESKPYQPKQELKNSTDYTDIGLKAKENQNQSTTTNTFDKEGYDKAKEEQNEVIRKNEEKRQEYENKVKEVNEANAKAQEAPTVEASKADTASDLTNQAQEADSKSIIDNARKEAEDHQLPELNTIADAYDKYYNDPNSLMVGSNGNIENSLVTDKGMPTDNWLRANGYSIDDTDSETMKTVAAVARGEMSIEEAAGKIKLRYEGGDPEAGLRIYLNSGIETDGLLAGTKSQTYDEYKNKIRQLQVMKANLIDSGMSSIDATNAVINYYKKPKNNGAYDLSSWGSNSDLASAGLITLSMIAPALPGLVNAGKIKKVMNASKRGGMIRDMLAGLGLTNINGTVTVGKIGQFATKLATAITYGGIGAAAVTSEPKTGDNVAPDYSTPVQIPLPEEPEYSSVPEVNEEDYRGTRDISIDANNNDLDQLQIDLEQSGIDASNSLTDIAQLRSLQPGTQEWSDAVDRMEQDLSKEAGALLEKKNTKDAMLAYRLTALALSASYSAEGRVSQYENDVFGENVQNRVDDILANPRLYSTKEVVAAQNIKNGTSDIRDRDAILKADSNNKLSINVDRLTTLSLIAAAATGDKDVLREALRQGSAMTGDDNVSIIDKAKSLNIEIPRPAFRVLSTLEGLKNKAADTIGATSAAQGFTTVKEWLSNAGNAIKNFFSKLSPSDTSYVGAMWSNVKKVLGNLFSPIKALDAGLKMTSDTVIEVLNIITKPFAKANDTVNSWKENLNKWHDMGVAAVEGNIKDYNDMDQVMTAINTAKLRSSVFGAVELVSACFESTFAPYLAMGTAANAFLKMYKAGRDMDDEAMQGVQEIMNALYNRWSHSTEHEEHNYQGQSLQSLVSHSNEDTTSIDDISATMNNPDSTSLEGNDVERDYSGWNQGLASSLYNQNPQLGASFVSNIAG